MLPLQNNSYNQLYNMTTTTTSAVKTLYTGLYQVNGGTQRLHYIAGPEGLAALIVTYSNNSTRTVYTANRLPGLIGCRV
jgi:hypothetical protein